jgi:alpha/beta superfamily hydrolase
MEREQVSFISDQYRLEGVLSYMRESVPAPGIVICHPHPQYGGSMDNNVVHALLHSFSSAGYIALAFNFRGVGRSQGMFGGGEGEQRDVKAALDFLEGLPHTKGQGLGFAGYSFGAWVGLQISVTDSRVRCVGVVSPPVSIFPFNFLNGYERPVIVLCGDRDPFCAPADIEYLLTTVSGPKEWKVLTGADHFYVDEAREASEYICRRFPQYLPPAAKVWNKG